MAQYPLLALSGHPFLHCECPLSGVKRTRHFALQMSANDPKRAYTAKALGLIVSPALLARADKVIE